jgi:cobalt-zinc-cadmium efflux system protein
MAHDHHGHDVDYSRVFAFGIILNVGFIVVEVVFGLLAASLALLADAGHNLSDVIGLILAWGGMYLATLKRTEKRTYGWKKASILAALINSIILFITIGGIGAEAVKRFIHPAPVAGATVIIVAAVGVVINAVTAILFLEGRKEDINIKSAFLHMAADAAVSLGVVAAGVAIYFTGWYLLDPLISLVIAVVVLLGTLSLFRDSFNLTMDAVPAGIDVREIHDYLSHLPGIVGVHDLHVWAMSSTEVALTAHLVKPDHTNDDELIHQAGDHLREEFGIGHVTIQWERG